MFKYRNFAFKSGRACTNCAFGNEKREEWYSFAENKIKTMKKHTLLALLCAGSLLYSCGGEKSEYEGIYENKESATPAAAEEEAPAQPVEAEASTAPAAEPTAADLEEGAKLISFSDCLSCHQENQKLVGPSYLEVAQKYENYPKNVDYLATKIIEGGSGVWGQVPMTPHPDLSRADARKMAQYILSLK